MYAPVDVVLLGIDQDQGYGTHDPTLRLPDGHEILLAHVRNLSTTQIGSTIHRGSVIAQVGGNRTDEGYPTWSTGCHLHFEARPTGGAPASSIDPAPYLSPNPGGWWLGPTPSDGTSTLVSPLAMQVNVHGQDYTNSGLNHINITWRSESSNQWSAQTKWLGSQSSSDYSFNIPAPVGGWPNSMIISFDVYANNGQVGEAPQGMRRVCRSGTPCSPVTVNPPAGGPVGGGGGGGQPSSTCTPGTNQTALFTDQNYGGSCVVKGLGDYADPTAIGLPNDSISSIKVGGGANVWLCDNAGINNPCEWFNADDPDLANNSINTNTVSSVRVVGGQPTTNCVPAANEVAFFVDANYGGTCVNKNFGTYDDPGALNLPNDSISSIKVGDSAKVRACDNAGNNSPCEEFDYNDPDLSNNSINRDTISSAKVYLRGGISLCEGSNYGGQCRVFSDGNTNLADYGWANRAHSVLFSGAYSNKYHIVLYTSTNQTGALYHADNSVPNLDAPYGGGIQSIKIYPHLPPNTPAEPSPADGAVLPNSTTTATISYHVYNQHRLHVWGTNYDVQQDWADGPVAPINGLQPGTYYWQVQEQNDMGPGPWSPVWSFSVNTPPMVAGGQLTMDGGTTQSIQIQATDAEQQPVTLSASGLPGFAGFVDNGGGVGTLTLAPGANAGGNYTITATASDGEVTGTGTIAVTVNGSAPPSGQTVFEDFQNGAANWGSTAAGIATSGSNSFMHMTPPSGAAAETSRNTNAPVLANYNAISVRLNTHGTTLLGSDASALYLDQGGGWKYVALSNYVQQGLDGWQTVTVPLSNFTGFNKAANLDRLGFRFWVPNAATIDVDDVVFLTDSTPPPVAGSYQAQYYNNLALSGTPVLTRNEQTINNDWGMGSPDASVNADLFSARWTKTEHFDAGTYRFTATADDGLRLKVDGQTVIDQWIDQGATTYTADKTMTAGDHTVVYEYYENGGGAVAKLSYALAPPASSSDYQAQYFNNTDLSGTPVFSTTEATVDHDWGEGSPDNSIPDDFFSARWTKTADFAAGTYRFTTTADDGIRLKIDGQTVIDRWIDQPPTVYTIDKALTAGSHTIVYEYYESDWGAVAKLSYQLAPTQTNLATSGSAYRWWKNASSTSNSNKIAATALNDGNTLDDITLSTAGQTENSNAYEAAGIIWTAATTVSSVEFTSGSWTNTGDGAFTANFKLQFTADGTTWTNATGWTAAPGYSYDSPDSAGRAYVFSGTPASVKGVRVLGQVRTPNASSWYAQARELRVY